MKSRVVFWTVALMALCVITAVAADVSGKWTAQVPGRGGEMREQVFTFKVDGETLTGTISSPRGDLEITDGKISGDEISFTVVMKFQEREMRWLYKGAVSGDEIKFTREMEGTDRRQEFTAKRQ